MKNTIQKTLLIAILMLIGSVSTFAQLKVSLNMNSHPDPYLSHWPDIKNTVIVTVTNSGKKTVPAKFDCKVNLNGNLVANTKPESMRILQIAPGTTQFFAEDLVPFEAVKVVGGADRTAVKTGMLPAGDYEFCVLLIDPQTSAQLTPPVCKNFTLVSYQGPVLLQPETKSTLGKTQRLPMFRWSQVSPKPPYAVTYRVVVMEILKGQTPVTAFRVNRPILDRTVTATQLMWPADVDLPKEGMEYIWGVQALDDSGKPIIDQANGFSEPFTFSACCQGDTSGNEGDGIVVHQHGDSVKTTDPSLPALDLRILNEMGIDTSVLRNTLRPQGQLTALAPLGDIGEGKKNVEFSWNAGSLEKSTDIRYEIKLAAYAADEDPEDALNGPLAKVIARNLSSTNYNYTLVSDFKEKTLYAWNVSATTTNGKLLGKSSAAPWSVGSLTGLPGGCILSPFLTPPIVLCQSSLPAPMMNFVFNSSPFGCTGATTYSVSSIPVISGLSLTGAIPVIPAGTPAGVYSISVTINRGTCHCISTDKLIVIPAQPVMSVANKAICCGHDNTFTLLGTTLPIRGVLGIGWQYEYPVGTFHNFGTNPPTGTSINTNDISAECVNCTTGLLSYTIPVHAYLILDANVYPNLTNGQCAGLHAGGWFSYIQVDGSYQVVCPPKVGPITATSSTSFCQSVYNATSPIVTVSATYTGTLTWTVTGPSGSVIVSPATCTGTGTCTGTFVVPGPGTYSITATVKNCVNSGLDCPCPAVSTSTTVTFEAPINCTISATPSPVCPPDGSVVSLGNCSLGNYTVAWAYQINCTGTWYPAGGSTGSSQNTNAIAQFNASTLSMCWRAIVTSNTGICGPVPYIATIVVNHPPGPISISSPNLLKCVGSPATINVTCPTTGSSSFTASLYSASGGLVQGPVPCCPPNPIFTGVIPEGLYWVEVSNMCGKVKSNFLNIKDCKSAIEFKGNCCRSQQDGQLCANLVSDCTATIVQWSWSLPIDPSNHNSCVTIPANYSGAVTATCTYTIPGGTTCSVSGTFTILPCP